MNYKDAGVDIEAGNAFVELISQKVKSTHRPEVLGGFGGFNGMMRIPSGYEKPVLVSGTDGVGTKLNVAELDSVGDNKTPMYNIGIDLVAMCVNDVITCGAEPLYFLDYISTRKIKPEYLKQVIFGIGDGCHISGCSLLGGETAEHPKHMGSQPIINDVAGFCTGIIEEDEIIDGKLIKPGDKIIGIESSGLHSNGFSLIRWLLFHHKIFIKDTPELLVPTTIYAPLVKKLLDEVPILGMAHITGGGIPENLPRCLPQGLKAHVDYNAWPMPEIFTKIMFAGEIPQEDMISTFNIGIGYCLVVPDEVVFDTRKIIRDHDLKCWVIGEVVNK